MMRRKRDKKDEGKEIKRMRRKRDKEDEGEKGKEQEEKADDKAIYQSLNEIEFNQLYSAYR